MFEERLNSICNTLESLSARITKLENKDRIPKDGEYLGFDEVGKIPLWKPPTPPIIDTLIDTKYIADYTFKVGNYYLLKLPRSHGMMVKFLKFTPTLLTFMGTTDKWFVDISHGFNPTIYTINPLDYPNEVKAINEQLMIHATKS